MIIIAWYMIAIVTGCSHVKGCIKSHKRPCSFIIITRGGKKRKFACSKELSAITQNIPAEDFSLKKATTYCD